MQQFEPHEAYSLMQHALMILHKDKESVKNDNNNNDGNDSNDGNDDPMIRINKLEEHIKGMETKVKQDKQNQAILTAIDRSLSKFDLTKNGNPISNKIKVLALAKLQYNPRNNIEELIASEVKDFMEIFEEKNKDLEDIRKSNAKVATAVSGIVTGAGGVPVVDTEKKFTPKDLQGTASREAMEIVLKSLE